LPLGGGKEGLVQLWDVTPDMRKRRSGAYSPVCLPQKTGLTSPLSASLLWKRV